MSTDTAETNSPIAMAGLPEPGEEKVDDGKMDAGASSGQVIDLATRRPPHDRLPVTFFGAPPKASLYHTQRAEDARQRAETEVTKWMAEARQTLFDAGLRRVNVNCADVADHNAMTLAYALAYAECGLHVVDSHAIYPRTGEPTGKVDGKPSAKIPRGAGWGVRASIDPEEITSFWTGSGEYPPNSEGHFYPYAWFGAPRNVSITFPVGCFLFVVDEDGEEGMAAVRALEVEHGALPRTAESISGSGVGRHRIFRSKRPILNTGSQLAPKVDIRGEGGQIIAAPSVHATGGYYTWKDGCAPWDGITDAPEWLEELAYTASAKNAPRDAKGKVVRTGSGAVSHPGLGFAGYLAVIGDGDDHEGFDGPIYRAACSWWGSNPDGDADDLVTMLRDTILNAPCTDDRAEMRYASDDYLINRVDQARRYIEANREEDDATPDTATRRADAAPERAEEDASRVYAEAISEVAATFTTESTEADITAFLTDLFQQGADKTVLANVTKVLADQTNLGKRGINAMVKALQESQRTENRRCKKTGEEAGAAIVNDWDFMDVCSFAHRRMMAYNARTPTVFQYMDGLATVREDPDGRAKIKALDKDGFAHHVNEAARFARVSGESEKTLGVACPHEVVWHLFRADYGDYPALNCIITTPGFSAEGKLLSVVGYDESSRLYYHPNRNLSVPDVSPVPTEAEVTEAKRLLIEEVLADFPIDGLSRDNIVAGSMSPDGDGIPSVTHAIAMALQPFVRDMINGPVPGYAVNKKMPGTGATLLVDALSTIYGGHPTSAASLPPDEVEMTKTLLPIIMGGKPYCFFDNVSTDLDSKVLASAMTSRTFEARLLGSSSMVEVDTRVTVIITGNDMRATGELVRRFALINMDAKTAVPEDRIPAGGWRHDEIVEWVAENRGVLVWACLTLVQNYIAKGAVPGTEHMGSYTAWTKVMGGILRDAGLKGFLANKATMAALSSDTESPVQQLMNHLANFPAGTRFVTSAMVDGTVSIKDVLEDFYGTDQPLNIDGWGYSGAGGGYTNIVRLGTRLSRAMDMPYRCGGFELSFMSSRTAQNKTVWTSVHTPILTPTT